MPPCRRLKMGVRGFLNAPRHEFHTFLPDMVKNSSRVYMSRNDFKNWKFIREIF